MKIKITDIKVGSRYRKDLGDLTFLANSIGELGLLHPIVVNQDNQLIAGERRLEACKSLGLREVDVHVVNMQDILTVKKGELHENGLRKDFTISEAVAIKRALEPEIKAEAQERMKAGKPCANLAQGKSRDIIADYLGYSHGKLDQMENIVQGVELGLIPEETLEKIDNDKTRVNKIDRLVKIEQKKQQLTKQAPGIDLPDGIQLYNLDFRNIGSDIIPDNSIDLIFTDPPYGRESVPLYEDLAEFASRKLKDGGSLVVYTGQSTLDQVMSVLSKYLKYVWQICVKHSGHFGKVRLSGVIISVAYKPLLWYVKGERCSIPAWIVDYVESKPPDKVAHDWQQSTVEAEHMIKDLTVENQIVLDPMMGSGTTGIAVFNHNRKFIGIEIDKNNFDTAKLLISDVVKEKKLPGEIRCLK